MTQTPVSTTTGASAPGGRPPAWSPARVVRTWWVWAALAALVSLTLGTWAGGGLDEVPEEGLPRVPADARVALGPYDIAITGWTVSNELNHDDLKFSDADAWVVIAADVTVQPPRSTTFYDDTVTVSALELTDFPDTVSPRDGSLMSYLSPGVTTPVLLLLPVNGTDADTLDQLSTLPVLLSSRVWTSHSLSGEMGWWRTTPRATVQVPRDDSVAVLEEPQE